jgi:hypothetical protein
MLITKGFEAEEGGVRKRKWSSKGQGPPPINLDPSTEEGRTTSPLTTRIKEEVATPSTHVNFFPS